MSVPVDKKAKSFFHHCDDKLNSLSDEMGNLLVNIFHQLALFAIGAATVWAGVHTFLEMVAKGSGTVEDLLLLFIFLEVGAMVGIYFQTKRMPVRFLIYVAITVLTRLLISIANHHEKLEGTAILLVSGSILLLAVAALLLRYASFHFPSDIKLTKTEDDS